MRCLANAQTELPAADSQLARRPASLSGPIVCGPVVADKTMKAQLKQINRKFLAIETESAGVFHSLREFPQIDVITIRGISDLADANKRSDEDGTGGAYRRIAAFNAASFLVLQLTENSFFSEPLKSRSDHIPPAAENKDPIDVAVSNIIDATEATLAELSPDYKALARGYRLPVPRVKELNGDPNSDMLEPLDLVRYSRISIVNIPSSYPDRGLPHVYAKNLVGSMLGGRIVLPVSVDASDIRPPRGSICDAASARGLGDLLGDKNIQPVVILHDFPSSSPTRRHHIANQIASLPQCIFIIMATDAVDSFSLTRDAPSSWKTFQLCAVSFRSLVDFLNAQFQIEAKEAEVIALRLSDTFRSFNLSAHPSYFAGIPREMLARFSEVTHRAEIIDLAVTGFLSFLGAGDTKDVNLKLRTRRIFLRDLAYRIRYQKQQFTLADLVKHVEIYSDSYDLGLDPLEFAQSFIKNGILSKIGSKIEFTIPFIDSYLLAEHLAEAPDEARSYFDPNKGDVDFRTFELYSEIGLSKFVFSDVVARIKSHIGGFSAVIGESEYTRFLEGRGEGSYKRSGHALSSGEVKPSMFRDYKRLVSH